MRSSSNGFSPFIRMNDGWGCRFGVKSRQTVENWTDSIILLWYIICSHSGGLLESFIL